MEYELYRMRRGGGGRGGGRERRELVKYMDVQAQS